MISITSAQPRDVPAFVALAEEMDRYYGATEVGSQELRVEQINEAIFGNPPSAHVLLAWNDGSLVGFACYSFLWPAIGLTRSLFLKELYVTEKARRHGAGKRLMRHLHSLAIQNGCSRVEWMTETTNADARQFYASLGAQVDESKVFYRVQGELLERMAE